MKDELRKFICELINETQKDLAPYKLPIDCDC